MIEDNRQELRIKASAKFVERTQSLGERAKIRKS
jgi:hypothetical protein